MTPSKPKPKMKAKMKGKKYIGIKDRNGKKVYEGNLVKLPYVDPKGVPHFDSEYSSEAKVVYRHACYMLEIIKGYGYTEHLQVFGWLEKERGEYVPNFGNKTIVSNKAMFEVIK